MTSYIEKLTRQTSPTRLDGIELNCLLKTIDYQLYELKKRLDLYKELNLQRLIDDDNFQLFCLSQIKDKLQRQLNQLK